jgi:hypothetical protein
LSDRMRLNNCQQVAVHFTADQTRISTNVQVICFG